MRDPRQVFQGRGIESKDFESEETEETEVRKGGRELITALVAKRQIEVVRCPKRKKMDEKRTESNSSLIVRCYDCSVIGHKKLDCPKKKENKFSEKSR